MAGVFKGSPSRLAAVMTLDSEVDITIAAGDHPFANDELYLRGIVAGNGVFIPEPSRAHGLNPLQVGISSTRAGECWRLVPQEAALTTNGQGARVATRESYEAYKKLMEQGDFEAAELLFLRVSLESELDIREGIALDQLGDEATDDEVEALAASLPLEVVNKFPFQGRGSVLLNKSLVEGDLALAGVSGDEISAIMDAVRRDDEVGLAAAEQFVERLGLNPDDLESSEVRSRLAPQIAAMLKGGSEPKLAPYWGLPEMLFLAHSAGEKAFKEFQEIQGWDNDALIAYGAKSGTSWPVFHSCTHMVGYHELTLAIQEEDDRYSAEMEAYESQADASRVWMNLSALVEGISEGAGFDVRPRPEMTSVPMADDLGEFEAEAIKQSMLRQATPRDVMQFRGSMEVPLGEMVPYAQDQEGTVTGHPLAWKLSQILGMAGREQSAHDIVDEDGERAIQEKWEIQNLLVPDGKVECYEADEIDGIEVSIPIIGVEGLAGMIMDWRNDGACRVLIEQPDEVMDPSVKYEIQKTDKFILEETGYEVGGKLTFNSQIGLQAWLAQYLPVSVIKVDSQGNAVQKDGNSLEVHDLPACEVFPKLVDFCQFLADAWEGGQEFDINAGEDVLQAALEAVNEELSLFQKEQMDLVVQANLVHFEDVIGGIDDAHKDLKSGLTPRELRAIHGRLTSMVWAAVSRMTEESFICPRPVRKVGNEWKLNVNKMWRVMGFQPTGFFKNLNTLRRMVQDRIIRVSPLENAKRKIWERDPITDSVKSRFVWKSLITWTDKLQGQYSMGLLGDELAQWWKKAVGINLPALKKNLFEMTDSEVYAFFTEALWGRTTAGDVIRFRHSFDGRKSMQKMSIQGVAEMLFPVNGSDEHQETNWCRQLMLVSPMPKMTKDLFEIAMGLERGSSEEKEFKALVQVTQKDLGASAKVLLEM